MSRTGVRLKLAGRSARCLSVRRFLPALGQQFDRGRPIDLPGPRPRDGGDADDLLWDRVPGETPTQEVDHHGDRPVVGCGRHERDQTVLTGSVR